MDAVSREARRRKIREGGSDRLGLIAGRLQNLPDSHSEPTQQPRHAHTASSPSLPFPDHIIADTDGDNGNASRGNNDGRVELRKCETNLEPNRRPPPQFRPRMQPVQPMFVRPMVHRSSFERPPIPESPGSGSSPLFTPKQISSCIMASENTRAISSAMIAFLVVLSYIDYRLFGVSIVSSKSIITSRPLYMLLLTEITIVLGWLVVVKRRGIVQDGEGERAMYNAEAQAWLGAVRYLEIGLVVYQSIEAIFIDYSIYAVFVVCGLSLL